MKKVRKTCVTRTPIIFIIVILVQRDKRMDKEDKENMTRGLSYICIYVQKSIEKSRKLFKKTLKSKKLQECFL